MIIHTNNSTYEINTEELTIRRLAGKAPATERQGQDGEWKSYVEISTPKIGEGLMVVWRYVDGIAKATYTSDVVSIDGDVLNKEIN